jgi:hypothetical protein
MENNLSDEFQYVENKIENEGVGYYILHYTDSSSMPDSRSKELFDEAYRALTEFTQYIEEKANEYR